jgi:Flp pilus assembly protein TadD
VEDEREVYALVAEAERQMSAEEFGAAVATLRKALALDGANTEVRTGRRWAERKHR